MECKDVKEKLLDYWDGKLDKDARNDFEKHLLSCKTCAEELQYLKKADKAIEKWPGLEPSPGFEAKLRQKIELEETKTKKAKLRWFYFSAASAAILAVIIVVLNISPDAGFKIAKMEGSAFVISKGVKNPLTASLRVKESDAIETGNKSGVDIEISKNSLIRIKENSRVRVDKSAEKDGVEEYVFNLSEGEFLGKVKKANKSLNFAVNTPYSNV